MPAAPPRVFVFSLVQLFMAVTLIAILVAIYQSGSIGTILRSIDAIEFSPDGDHVAVRLQSARWVRQGPRSLGHDVCVTAQTVNIHTGQSAIVEQRTYPQIGPVRHRYHSTIA